jgi:chemotaxis protein histidine kinase CheA
MSSNQTLAETQFAERIAKVRARFISKLAEKIEATDAALPQLAEDSSDAIEAVSAAYRRFHDMVGISSTIGFEATGQVARTLEAILTGPFRDRRGLRGDELSKLKEGLEALQITALTEIQPKD